MDQDKLGKLRARYAGASGGDIHDPRFAKVAADQFQGDRRHFFQADAFAVERLFIIDGNDPELGARFVESNHGAGVDIVIVNRELILNGLTLCY